MAKYDRQKKRRAADAQTVGRRRKRKRAGRRTLHLLVILLFLLAAGAVLSLTVFFKIEDIVVSGTDKYDPDEIIADSGVRLEENLFRVSQPQVRERLLAKYPYIEDIKLERRFPPTIEIAVTQAVPAGAAMDGDECALITRDGKVLERGSVFIPADVPVIKGLQLGRTQPGETLGEENSERLVMLGYLFAAIRDTGFTEVTNVDLTDRLDIRIVYENRILLRLGTEADLKDKLIFVQRVLKNNIRPEEKGVLDASKARDGRINFLPGDINRQEEDSSAESAPSFQLAGEGEGDHS